MAKFFQNGPFQSSIIDELEEFQISAKKSINDKDYLKIDLHCHDFNSDVPDELLGRILNVPETWLKTDDLLATLQKNNCSAITITNHNNARSCYEQKELGRDILTGAEFSCTVPDFNVGIHVLTYGFTVEQEKQLNRLRHNVYNFQRYTKENDIPTIWAHPLYHYSPKGTPGMEFFEKMALIFERFEVLNGQRDTWQNMLVKNWIEQLTPARINTYAEKYNIDPKAYCKLPYRKSMSGGSDSHMGIFAGQTGTMLYIPNLVERLKTEKASDLALEAIKLGNMMPFGSHQNSEKLNVALLDYVLQIALYRKDPGLMRILLHKGTTRDKLLALLVTNGFAELSRHKVTMQFIDLFHNSFSGIQPSKRKRWFVPKAYKPIYDEVCKIANIRNLSPDEMASAYQRTLQQIGTEINGILYGRLNTKINNILSSGKLDNPDFNKLLNKLEIPGEFRALMSTERSVTKNNDSNNIADILDGLSFPFLTSLVLTSTNFASTRVMYHARPLLEEFSKSIGKLEHPQRMLWLTDTFGDKNGVSMVLKEMLTAIREYNLPIDILACSNTLKSEPNLVVVKPQIEFSLPFYQQQPIRIPNLTEIHHIFHEGEYDRIMCSTEGIMGLISLYLKHAYTVKTHFFMHTDWLTFARKALHIDRHNLSRMRRMLRAFYKEFDSVFVLNSDHKKWLISEEMGIIPEQVKLTAHWVDKKFSKTVSKKEILWGIKDSKPVLLYAGRLSKEKGVMELPEIYLSVKQQIPSLQMVFAGSGPAEVELKEKMPDAIFAGWINHNELPIILNSADLLILPSKFDTFSVTLLESLSCGTPVLAYNMKGPKDIIEHQKSGFLANNNNEMIMFACQYFEQKEKMEDYKKRAIDRAKAYSKTTILKQLLKDFELDTDTIKEEYPKVDCAS